MDQEQTEIQAARDKLAARFANATQIGGKGKPRPRALLLATNKIFMLPVLFRHPEKKEEAC
jgi:hypothetical protein